MLHTIRNWDSLRQVAPGLVLIGETGVEDRLPIGSCTLVTADYPPKQRLSRSGLMVDAPLVEMSDPPAVTPVPFAAPRYSATLP